ncbi:uncharacterized protein LOC110035994, partial [Phalaenopsis equestris]|uniref:uncharacterized protein LOC110035994 n=1 Tax=Phalaenopsis equestris TaxID=78828 RepID=UPI0009E4BFA6
MASYLKQWNWHCFGNVYEAVEKAEKNLESLEAEIGNGNASEAALLENAEKKAAINRLMGGDRNTKYYHACIKYKRKCNNIHKIQDAQGCWINNYEDIAKNVVDYFQNLLTTPHLTATPVDPQFFQEELIYTHELQLSSTPTESEIWEALNTIDNSEVVGPDGYIAAFYKKSWSIIIP